MYPSSYLLDFDPEPLHYTGMAKSSVAHFDFNLPKAVLEQLVDAFKILPIGPLTLEALEDVEDIQGVYQLYLSGKLMYLGKADTDLRGRLVRHFYTLKGRKAIKIENCGFKGLYLHDNWAASLHEDNMLKHYKGESAWNNSGFGSNDPGKQRDTTVYPDDAFDVLFPIDLDFRTNLQAGDFDLWNLLGELKEATPYTFRFETAETRGKPHADYKGKVVKLKKADMSFRDILACICQQLPTGWQATEIPSRVILYKESKSYPRGNVLWPKG